jgi:bifunctional UDP-N-acetylglucosamine pyrophosphorylase/glucosamine-1-phosphate N-acetyltransferase
MLIAPLTIGDGAYTAAGSVIDQDVPPGAIAVARGRQRNIEGWVARKRPGSAADHAARRAIGRGADGGTSDPADTAQSEQDEPTTEHKGQGA